jgi:hypothetical protein
LRYPEPTDPVAQGATAIRNLAEDVTGKYGATPYLGGGWLPFYPTTAPPAGQVMRMIGGQGNVNLDSAGTSVLTLSPSGVNTIVSIALTPTVVSGSPEDINLNASPRAVAGTLYVYAWKAGVQLKSRSVGVAFIAIVY